MALRESYEQRRAEGATEVAQWEYRIELLEITPTGFYLHDTPQAVERLNALGDEGWEIAAAWREATTSLGVIIFKRPKSK